MTIDVRSVSFSETVMVLFVDGEKGVSEQLLEAIDNGLRSVTGELWEDEGVEYSTHYYIVCNRRGRYCALYSVFTRRDEYSTDHSIRRIRKLYYVPEIEGDLESTVKILTCIAWSEVFG